MFELVLRITFSLLVVLGLMWGLAKLARRPLTGRGGAALTVLTRQQLSRTSSIAVVRVVDRALVVGVTDGHVTLLTETDLAAVERQLAGPTERRDAITLNPGDDPDAVAEGDVTAHDDIVNPVEVKAPAGRLDGSLLSPATWTSTLDFLRERTVRR